MRIEKYIEDTVTKAAEAEGWLVMSITWRGETGAPDRLFLKDGDHIWIEFKSPGESPRADQVRAHKKLRDRGAEVFVVDTVEAGKKVLEIGR